MSAEVEEPKQSPEVGVAGERTVSMVSQARSMHARMNQWIAIALMVSLGVVVLALYYGHVFAQAKQGRLARDKQTRNQMAGEMILPRLHVDAPAKGPAGGVFDVLTAPEVPASEMAGGGTPGASATPYANPYASPMPAGKPVMSEEERELSAPVLWRKESSAARVTPAAYTPEASPDMPAQSLGPLLQATATPAVAAQVLPTQRLLLPKGASVDCTLQTAIDSTLPGLSTCITAVDVFGADGRVVLLERGTQLVGETRSEVRQGQARVFVLWTQARTPMGVVIPLLSPGTDELGRSGLSGHIDRHFEERFGAAILVSIIDGLIQAGVASQRSGGGTSVVFDPQGSREVMTGVLKDTIKIPPTIRVDQGSRIAVLVARDVDFRSVYRLSVRE